MRTELPRKPLDSRTRSRFRGCLLGGAVGDALGAPVEFMSAEEIRTCFGPAGIRDFAPAFGRLGAITDDTQMMLFTAEGLMRGYLREQNKWFYRARGMIGSAYMRWLHTQGEKHRMHEVCLDGWLISHRELFARRAPGNTCLSALHAMNRADDLAESRQSWVLFGAASSRRATEPAWLPLERGAGAICSRLGLKLRR